MARPRTLTLTPMESRLHATLLTSMTSKEIQGVLRLNSSQFWNGCKRLYVKKGARDRVDLMGQTLTREVAARCRLMRDPRFKDIHKELDIYGEMT